MHDLTDPTQREHSARMTLDALTLIGQGTDLGDEIVPVSSDERSGNELRPNTLDEMIGQPHLKPLLRRLITTAKLTGRPLDHLLLIGASGTGKTTTAHVVAHEMGARVFQLGAPVSQHQLAQLREIMHDGDMLFVDEIHQQVAPDRRGVTSAAAPEHFYQVLEDRRLVAPNGVLEFPAITVIGGTTDAGLLPEPFLARFPLQPRLEPYSVQDMALLAQRNADALSLTLDGDAAMILARAARANPRTVNRYMRNCQSLSDGVVTPEIAREVVEDLNTTTLDGLTLDMRRMLTFLYTSGKRTLGDGEVRYQASVNTIATALGKSRDTKAIALYVEPYLIERGYIQVGHGGRLLTEAGIQRARELCS